MPRKVLLGTRRALKFQDKTDAPCDWSGVYVIRAGRFCKIGKADDIVDRMRTMQTDNAEELELVAYWRVQDAHAIETTLHSHYYRRRYRGEWFKLDDLICDTLSRVENITEWLRQRGYLKDA